MSNIISFKRFLTENYLILEVLSKSTSKNIDMVKGPLTRRIESENLGPHQSGDPLDHLRDALDNIPSHHAQWALTRYNKGSIGRLEDIPEVRHHLEIFDQMVERGETDKGVLSKLATPKDLKKHILNKSPSSLPFSDMMDVDDLDPKEYTITHEDENFKVVIPHTKRASICFGGGSSWCTAKEGEYNLFDHYNKQGPLHILLPKHTRNKFQFHAASNQLMDMDDQESWTSDIIHNTGAIPPIGSVFHTLHVLPSATKEGQAKMFTEADRHTRRYILERHPNLAIHLNINDPEDHALLAEYGTSAEHRKLVIRPDLHPDAHKFLATSYPNPPGELQYGRSHTVQHILMDRSDLNPDAHKALAQYGDDTIRDRLMDRSDLNPDAHNSLLNVSMRGASTNEQFKKISPYIPHRRVATLPNLHREAQIALSRSDDKTVHNILVNRADLNPSTHIHLAMRGDRDVHRKLVTLGNLSSESYVPLIQNGNNEIHNAIMDRNPRGNVHHESYSIHDVLAAYGNNQIHNRLLDLGNTLSRGVHIVLGKHGNEQIHNRLLGMGAQLNIAAHDQIHRNGTEPVRARLRELRTAMTLSNQL